MIWRTQGTVPSYFARRIVRGLATTLLAMTLVFTLARLLPGDPSAVLGTGTPQSVRDAFLHERGLDRSLGAQLVSYMGGLARGELGESTSGRPVAALVAERIPTTVQLVAVSIAVEVALLGIMAFGMSAHPRLRANLVRSWGVLLAAIPLFVLAAGAQDLLGIRAGLFPATSTSGDPRELLLPGLILGAWSAAFAGQVLIRGIVNELDSEHVRAARAKGLPTRLIMRFHVLPNAVAPATSFVAADVAAIFTGTVVVESIFNIPGFGLLVFSSLQNRDVAVTTAAVGLSALLFSVTTIAADAFAMALNPMVRSTLLGRRR